MAVGIATVDTINEVEQYPEEDSEVRIYSQNITRGGNATNTLVVLKQLGHNCFWTGTLANDINQQVIIDDLDNYQIDYSYSRIIQQATNPTSYILLSREKASRSITHYRNLVEYSFNAFRLIPLEDFDCLHFEGRNVAQVLKMMAYCKVHYPKLKLSLEIEKPRPQIDSLFKYADVILFSKHYAESNGFTSAQNLLKHYQKLNTKIISCAWGNAGADLSYYGKIYNSSAYEPKKIVDTLAAGDTFNAALIHAVLLKLEPQQIINYACKLAGLKCAIKGLDLKSVI